MVAASEPVAGYIVLNGWVRAWDGAAARIRAAASRVSGVAAADVSERQRKLTEFYTLFLEQQKMPRQVIAERPELASVWNDGPEHQYGRPARFHHQLQRINAARAWSEASTCLRW